MAATVVKRGSIVLARYPFTDLSGAKLRPAVIVMPDDLLAVLDDALCAFITSTIPDRLLSTDLFLQTTHADFKGTGLKASSVVRAHKLALLHRSLIDRRLGQLSEALLSELDNRLKKAVGIDEP